MHFTGSGCQLNRSFSPFGILETVSALCAFEQRGENHNHPP